MRLHIKKGPDIGAAYDLTVNNMVVGRDGACQIHLHDRRASRQHAQLYQQGGAWYVADMQSSNGTWINRHRIRQPQRLQSGDELGIGGTIFKVEEEVGWGADAATGSQGLPANYYATPQNMPYQQSKAYAGQGAAVATESRILTGFVSLGSVLLIVGAMLPWLSFDMVLIDIQFKGMDIIGGWMLIGGFFTLLATIPAWSSILMPQDATRLAPYLQGSYIAEVVLSGILIGRSLLEVLAYQQGAATELLWGYTLGDLFNPSPEVGLLLTALGVVLVFGGAVLQLIHHKTGLMSDY